MKVVAEEQMSSDGLLATVIVEAGGYSVAAFSHPYSLHVGVLLEDPLHVFSLRSVERETNGTLKVSREGKSLAHKITGILTDRDEGILSVGGLLFQIEDDLPGDLTSGDVVSIACDRVDIW